MADSKISNLTAALTPLTGAEEVAIVQSGATVVATVNDLFKESFAVACGDETTVLTVASGLVTFRMPYAFNLTEVRASLTTAGTGAALLTVIVNVNAVNIFSSGGTAITFDATEKTSTTATTPNVIGISAIADDAEITVDVTQLDTDNVAAGLKIYLIGNKT